MFKDTANIIQGLLRQATVLVPGKNILVALGKGLMHVHTITIVTDQGLWHESNCLAIGMRNIL